jgi:hypothetical protein
MEQSSFLESDIRPISNFPPHSPPPHLWKQKGQNCIKNASESYSEPVEFNTHPHKYLSKIHPNTILKTMSTPSKWPFFFFFRFQTKILYAFLISPILATCPVHTILELNILNISDEICKLRNFSLGVFLWPPATCALSGPCTPLCNQF